MLNTKVNTETNGTIITVVSEYEISSDCQTGMNVFFSVVFFL